MLTLAVIEAADGEATVRALTDGGEPFDVVLLDQRLLDSTDLKLLQTLRGTARHSVVIMMTAYSTPKVIHDAPELVANRVVPKPFELHEMAPLVLEANESDLRSFSCLRDKAHASYAAHELLGVWHYSVSGTPPRCWSLRRRGGGKDFPWYRLTPVLGGAVQDAEAFPERFGAHAIIRRKSFWTHA